MKYISRSTQMTKMEKRKYNKTVPNKKNVTIVNGIFQPNLSWKHVYIISVHEGNKHKKCKICDHSFSTKCNLKGHIASVHEGKEPFKRCTSDSCFTSNKDMN